MKVLYIHQYFRKPEHGGAIRSYYLSKALVDSGSEVELITSHNNPNYRLEIIEGIKVHFLPVKYDNRFSNFRRKLSFISFFIRSYFFAIRNIRNIDICYASSTPLTVGITALLLKKINGIRYYFEVRDLWPEAPIQMGAVKNPVIKRILVWFEKLIYQHAEKIIALSPGMADGVRKYGHDEKVQVLSNISDCEFFQLEQKTVKNTFYYGVGDKFVISYFGAVGKVNNIDFILNLARECQKQELDEIIFLIAGKGSELRKLRSKSQQLDLKNVRFLGFQNRNEIKKLLNVTDASLITFKDKKVLETNSPNKFFDSIAAGKLCIVNNQGWVHDLIKKNQCGFYTNPNVTLDFVEKIKPYLGDEKLLTEAKQNARQLAEKHFSRKILTSRFIESFDLPVQSKKVQNGDQESSDSSIARA